MQKPFVNQFTTQELDPVNQGMPAMNPDAPPVSFFEFWPAWVFYTPVAIQSFFLGIRYLDWRLPLISNPAIFLSGMVGESKSDIFQIATGDAKDAILTYVKIRKTAKSIDKQLALAVKACQDKAINYPLVAKPDQGCRGTGVKLIQSDNDLRDYLEKFPTHSDFILQKKSKHSAEAGIYYVRYPQKNHGQIHSITLKYRAYVLGDGIKTLKQLIETDPRAGLLSHLYFRRHTEQLENVIPKNTYFPLAFTGSHSMGAIFKNGNQYITEKLTQRIEKIFTGLDGVYCARIDIRFKDIDDLCQGGVIDIMEINGATGEAAHIWDSETPIIEAYRTLLFQYRCLYKVGYQVKQSGFKPPSFKTLINAWQQEKKLISQYSKPD